MGIVMCRKDHIPIEQSYYASKRYVYSIKSKKSLECLITRRRYIVFWLVDYGQLD